MDDQRLTTLMRELYDEGGTHRAPPFPANEMRSPRRNRWLAVAGAAVAAAAAVVVAVSVSNTSSGTARLVPVEGPTTASAAPSPSASPVPSPTPITLPSLSPSDDPQSGAGYLPTGIYSQGPQISSTRWFNINTWVDRVTPTTDLSVYAGGATIDPALVNPSTYAAVLVITPADSYKFDHGQVALGALGTIYRAPGSPVGKLRVTSATGSLVTLTLLGTSQTYVFNDRTMTFQ